MSGPSGADWSTVVAAISAIISVAAAVFASVQAKAAKRQAAAAHGEVQPTFHCELHEDNGRPPWGFRLKVRNFNRRPLRLKRVRVNIPPDLIVWADDDKPDTIREILRAATRRGGAPFEIDTILEGVSPNVSSPTAYDHDFQVGPRGDASDERRTVELPIVIEWEFVSGEASPQTERMIVRVPIGTGVR